MTVLTDVLPQSGALRRFAIVNAVNTVGTGLFLTASAIYLSTVRDWSAEQIALGLGVGAGAGLLLAVPVGRLADKAGVRRIYGLLIVAQAIGIASMTIAGSLTAFLAAVLVFGIAERGIAGTAGAYVGLLCAPGEDKVLARSQLRVSTNIGLAVGSLLAGIALAVRTDGALTVAMLAAAAILAGSAAGLRFITLPTGGPTTAQVTAPRPGLARAKQGALRDPYYMTVSVFNGFLGLHVPILTFALPLWIAYHTRAPHWTISAALTINTLMVVLLQIRLGRASSTPGGARRSALAAGISVGVACLLFAAATQPGPAMAVLLLALGVGVLTLGELWQVASQYHFSFELAPEHSYGEYQSAFLLGSGALRVVAPAVLSVVVLGDFRFGWGLVAVAIALSGWGAARSATWAARHVDRARVGDAVPLEVR